MKIELPRIYICPKVIMIRWLQWEWIIPRLFSDNDV